MKIKHSIYISICMIGSVLVIAVVTFCLSQGSCPRGSFACDDGDKCVLQREICDQRRDCVDGQDEDPMECGHYHGSIDFTVSVIAQNPPPFNVSKGQCALQSYPRQCICKQSTVLICIGTNLTDFPSVSSQVTSIYIRDNYQLRLSNTSLAGLNVSQILHLKHNRIDQLPSDFLVSQRRLRKLFLDHNRIAAIPPGAFRHLHSLEWLMLGDNRLRAFPLDELRHMSRLRTLNLSANMLTIADGSRFPNMPAIMEIYLEYNSIESIDKRVFGALSHLQFLSLSHNRIKFIANDAFAGMIDLRELKLSHNNIGDLEADVFRHVTKLDALFLGFNADLHIIADTLEYLNVTLLNLDGIDHNRIAFAALRSLPNLQAIVFHEFYYCSELPHIRKCKPNTDGVSSLTDLLTKPVLRYSAWTMAGLALLGNSLVVWGRLRCVDENRAVRLVIVNLAAADWLMGVYLSVIGVQDYRYRSGYQVAALDWTSSWQCTGAGMLAMVSCEVSLLIMAFMSVERFLLIADPFRQARPRMDSAKVVQVLLTIWLLGLLVAIVPAVQWRTSTHYYGTYTGVCFPLHLQEAYAVGWQYSALVVLGVNAGLLVVIGVLYTALLVSIWRTRKATEVSKFDFEFAVRFFFIVFTDALCWTPIMVTKVCVFCGVVVSADLYAWLMVFVLPLNSAVNPLLYTFTTPKYRKQVWKHGWCQFTTTVRRDQQHNTTEGSLTTNPDESQGKIIPLLTSIGQHTLSKWKW